MSLDKKIVEIRKNNNLSQEDLAEILNVLRQTISNWENMKCYPDIQTIIISDQFKISPDELLKDDMKMVKDIDEKVSKNSKLKIIIAILTILIFLVFSFLILKNYIGSENKRKNESIYQKIIINLNILSFEKMDDIAFSNLIENGVKYSIYSKMPEVLEKGISARYLMKY